MRLSKTVFKTRNIFFCNVLSYNIVIIKYENTTLLHKICVNLIVSPWPGINAL